MSTVAAIEMRRAPARAAAMVLGENVRLRRRAVELLTLADFNVAVCEGLADVPRAHTADGLIILVSAAADTVRVAEVKALAEAVEDARILAVMPAETRGAVLRRTLVAGASGILLESDLERALVVSARAILLDQLSVPSVLGRQIAPRPLSHREKEIITLVVRGLTNREIAAELFLAESTVKTHLSSAFRKLDARSRSEAVARIQDPESGFGMAILTQPEAG